MRLREQPPPWAAQYIGIEFLEEGRRRDRGLDCWGLVRLVYAERLGVMLPDHPGRERETVAEWADAIERGDEPTWAPTAEPELGDVGLFRVAGMPHVGLRVSTAQFLHVTKGIDSCIERVDSPAWARRLVGWHRFAGGVRLVGRPRPLASPRIDAVVQAGGTLEEILEGSGLIPLPLLRVYVGDVEVPRAAWARVRPKPGRTIVVAASAAGGRGGGKDVLRVVLSIAVIAAAVAAPFVAVGLGANAAVWGTGTLYGSLLAAGVGLGGQLLVNALLPPPKPRLSELGLESRISPTITGAQNQARMYDPIPIVLGRHRIAPLYGARPYTETIGQDTYLRMLFVVGYGPLELSEFKIGETSLDEFEGVEIEVRNGYEDEPPITLYPGTIREESMSVLLEQSAGWTVRTSEPGADELSIDVTFPQGLANIQSNGSNADATVDVEVQWSPTGVGDWQGVNERSPAVRRQMDYLFRSSEVAPGEFEGLIHTGSVAWGGSWPGAKPAYLPGTDYSWAADGWLYAPEPGLYQFGIDGSDAIDLTINGKPIAAWYGSHAEAGAYAHTGGVTLKKGWHRLYLRMEHRSTLAPGSGGSIALGWKKPSDAGLATIPAANISIDGAGSGQGLRVRWFGFADYDAILSTTAKELAAIKRHIAWAVPTGQFDIRVRRLTADAPPGSTSLIDKVYLTAIRSIEGKDPIRFAKPLCKVALRIKATDQLQGVIDEFNVIATSLLPHWDPFLQEWVERATSSPAAHYRALLQGPSCAEPIPDSRLDLPALQDLAVRAASKGLEYNGVIDYAGTTRERLDDVLSPARSSFGFRDTLLSIVADKPQSVPVQHFTPRNSWGFRGSRTFADQPHGLRVRYLNKDAGYQPDEMIAYADGYDATNATKFETIEGLGITSHDQAWKHGRYLLAVGQLRPESFSLNVDAEHLACTRGDPVYVTHDVPLFGLASGRVLHQVLDAAGNLTGLVVDEPCPMEAGTTYVVRVRLKNRDSFTRTVVTVPGVPGATTLDFQSPASAAEPRPEVGDLYMFGPQGLESRALLVKAIEMNRDLSARITLIDLAPGVHTADEGTIPPYSSGITDPPYATPEVPIIESIRSDDYVLVKGPGGELLPRMVITLVAPSGTKPMPSTSQVKYRPKPTAGVPTPWVTLTLPIDNREISVMPVTQGVTYQIKVRTVTAAGKTSEWAEAEHTIIGKSLPPPDLESFDVKRLGDGTRLYSWSFGTSIPKDVAGVQIRYGAGGQGKQWADLVPLHDGLLEGASPVELNSPGKGLWTFGIKAVDTTGLESANAILIDRYLGYPRQDDVAFSQDNRGDGWLGFKDGCYVSNDDALWAKDQTTWATLAGAGITSWAAWSRWCVDPINPIAYTGPVIDCGVLLDVEPDAEWDADGEVLVEFQHSLTGTSWSPWAPLAGFKGLSVQLRYARFRITTNSPGVGSIREFLCMLRAPMVVEDLQDIDTAGLGAGVLGDGDVRLPVSLGLFALIRSVQVSFNGQGAGWTWELVDKDVDGPRVRLYYLTSPYHSVIDATIRGVRASEAPPGSFADSDFDTVDSTLDLRKASALAFV